MSVPSLAPPVAGEQQVAFRKSSETHDEFSTEHAAIGVTKAHPDPGC